MFLSNLGAPRVALLAATGLIWLLLVACSSNGEESESNTGEESPVAEETPASSSVALVPAFGTATFDAPLDVDPVPGSPGEYFVIEKGGLIKLVSGDGTQTVVADLTARVVSDGTERGLLSLAVTPDFESTGRVLVYYSAGTRRNNPVARLSSFVFRDGVFDPREQIILEEPHVAALHWGGGMAFGLDGYLYLGIGDSERSGRGVEDRNAQNLQTLTGSILRIAIQDGGYDVPPDNPFVGSGNREEIWAYGFRNPWRLSIDPETGALWVADVGHRRVEEVNYDIVRGGNYGWDLVEGDLCFRENPCDQGLVAPLSTYSHDVGCAIVGGVIYRGDDLPELTGRYVFGDYCSGRISFISPDEPEPKPLVGADGQIYALAADEDGEILVLAADGVISRIEPGDGR